MWLQPFCNYCEELAQVFVFRIVAVHDFRVKLHGFNSASFPVGKLSISMGKYRVPPRPITRVLPTQSFPDWSRRNHIVTTSVVALSKRILAGPVKTILTDCR